MKQHITVEQLNELSKNKYKILYEWWSKGFVRMGCGRWVFLSKDKYPDEQKNIEPLLSIGQMIEFLDENEKDTCHDWRKDIFICEHYPDDTVSEINWSYDELCDALWEAVKEVLNDRHSTR